jgi:hypothetical protein
VKDLKTCLQGAALRAGVSTRTHAPLTIQWRTGRSEEERTDPDHTFRLGVPNPKSKALEAFYKV